MKPSRAAAELARELRAQRRTRSGRRWRPWPEIAEELERRGLGRWDPRELSEAVARLPIEGHALAPRSAEELAELERGWRAGWAAEFPGEPWPGLEEAQRRTRAKNLPPPAQRPRRA